MSRHHIQRAAWALAFAAIVIAAAPADGQVNALASLDGRYVFAGGSAERERLDRAIDAVVRNLPFVMREVARGEIRRNLQPERSIDVGILDDERVTLTLGAWGPHEVRLDGRPTRVRGPDGSDTRLSAVFRGGRIETRQESSRGLRENWLSASPDGRYLFLQSRVVARELPEAIRYTLSYRRVR